MINVLICDDDTAITAKVECLLNEIKVQQRTDFSIDIKNDGDFSVDEKAVYDIAILDIEMDGISGLQVAENLKKNNPDIIVIILTSFADYLDSAMKISVFRYLSKPIDEVRFKRNFVEALVHFRNISKQIVIKTIDGASTIKTKDILYIENMKHGSAIVTVNNRFKTNKKPVEWAQAINQPNCFISSHKSYIINLQNVVNFDKSTVTFQKGDELCEIPCVSRRGYTDLKESFFNFVGVK